MQGIVPIASRARCERVYPHEIDESMICAGFDQGGVGIFQGESGGPMVCETGGRYYPMVSRVGAMTVLALESLVFAPRSHTS